MPEKSKQLLSWQLVCALTLTLLIALTINGESLWTDEAFSAFIASHRTLGSLWNTLVGGDSSDLQMFLYYIYLFFWGKLFGLGEIAFRTANIPFGLLFSGVLVWSGQRLFGSRVSWIAAALSPLLWSFANDARPYFAVVAFSTVCVACLLLYVQGADGDKKLMPWLILGSLFLGATFHMLMLLVGMPLCIVLFLFWRANRNSIRWIDWKWPLAVMTPIALAEAAFLAWTFGRGATYEYAHPDFLSMASVVFRFVGLSGYYPNRRYDIPVRPYLPVMALSSVAFLAAVIALAMSARKSSRERLFLALGWALVVGAVQVAVMSVAIKQQVEARHLASLLPLLLFLIMAGLTPRAGEKWRRSAQVTFSIFVCLWLVSDIRLIFLPEYKREDFRSAVLKAIAVSKSDGGDIALVADPAAAAYYGLQVAGNSPCFPLTSTCAAGFFKTSWQDTTPAVYAAFWSDSQVRVWIAKHKSSGRPGIVLISRSRHPMYKDSPWWTELRYSQYESLFLFHGFYVYVIS